MVNTVKLKMRMVECGKDVHDVADAIGKSYETAKAKLENKAVMNLVEAENIQYLLCIPNGEFRDYFFGGGK